MPKKIILKILVASIKITKTERHEYKYTTPMAVLQERVYCVYNMYDCIIRIYISPLTSSGWC